MMLLLMIVVLLLMMMVVLLLMMLMMSRVYQGHGQISHIMRPNVTLGAPPVFKAPSAFTQTDLCVGERGDGPIEKLKSGDQARCRH